MLSTAANYRYGVVDKALSGTAKVVYLWVIFKFLKKMKR